MKKLTILLLSLLVCIGTLYSQNGGKNVAKECVLFELFTGVNCPYCPAAANGVMQMLDEGFQIAPVAFHTSAFSTSEFYTSETNARANYYSITSYPTLKADGTKTLSGGGSASENMYSYYVPLYNQRINQPAYFNIDLSCSSPVGTQYTVTCTVNEIEECPSDNLKVYIVLTQNHIQRSWQGMSELNFVVRDMIPNQNGTAYSGGDITITETFDMGEYPKEDCYLTAWVQNASTKEVYQAVKLSLNYPDYEYDVSVKSAYDVTKYNCSGTTGATAVVKNNGSVPITSFDVVVYANGNEVARESWSGDAIDFTETALVHLPSFDVNGASQITISAINPNGHEDENELNGKTITFEDPIDADEYIILVLRTDSKFEETSVEWINMSTGVVEETITYNAANKMYINNLYFTDNSCYRLAIYDSGNDGLSTYFTIYNKDEISLFNGQPKINPFYSVMAIEFNPTSVGIIENSDNGVTVFPNPSNGIVNIATGRDFNKVEIYDLTGRMIYSNPQVENGEISLGNIENGVYMMRVNDDTVQKIVIKR